MCKPLRNKEIKLPKGLKASPEGWAWYAKKDVKSACIFYKKYRDNPHWFKMRYPDLWKTIDDNEIYEHWLFNYCFNDVIE